MKKVQLITDGSCLGNPGPGGWAAILRYGPHTRELYGHAPHTTNNRMEMTAAIEGLKALREPCAVELITDSEYLMKGITQWIDGWKRKGWAKVKNPDLWQELDREISRHQVHWSWTRGHAEHVDNNRADELATTAARKKLGKGS